VLFLRLPGSAHPVLCVPRVQAALRRQLPGRRGRRPRAGRADARRGADNWGKKAIGRKTTGTGRCRYIKDMPRKFKNGFREGARRRAGRRGAGRASADPGRNPEARKIRRRHRAACARGYGCVAGGARGVTHVCGRARQRRLGARLLRTLPAMLATCKLGLGSMSARRWAARAER
jgi:hypothetical protein